MEHLSNRELSISVSPIGAEMQSLRLNASGRELLWQGDPAYWSGHSPILFPAVGGLWNGTCHIDGQVHALRKHGFMKEKDWDLVRRTADSLTFEYIDAGEDREAFPWPYAVRVTYTLAGRRVLAGFEVENIGNATMYFQMGGHPGFALPGFVDPADGPDGYLQLDGHPDHVLRAGEQGCTEPVQYPFPQTADGLVPLSVETFANEALIFENHQIGGVTLLDRDRRPIASVKSTAPVWLFWSPQGVHAPFVCAEPWYGFCDPIGFEGDISQRPFINNLEPGSCWSGGYEITARCD